MPTPTRRSMKQQTLHAVVGITSPNTVTPTATTTTTTPSDAKRATRGSAALQQLPFSPTTATEPAIAEGGVANTASDGTTALPIVGPLNLRPRRASTAPVGVTPPYERHAVDALRDECARRGLVIAPREQGGGKGPPRGKAHVIQLLQEADMLALFERQSQKKTGGRRGARGVKLTAPPAPIRVTATSSGSARRSLPIGAISRPAAGSIGGATKAPATAASPSKAAVAKKWIRPPPKNRTVQPVAEKEPLLTTAASASPSAKTIGDEAATATSASPKSNAVADETVQPTPAPWLAPTSEDVQQTAHSAELDEEKSEIPLTTFDETNLDANTVDLTVDSPTFGAAVQADATPELSLGSENAPSQRLPTKIDVVAPTPQPARPAVPSNSTARNGAARSATAPAIRARRGCRFRLINVVLSPDFNMRWSEMNVAVPSRSEVNAFWRDVHISFLCQNSFYDKVHFEDALFESVTPNVIQNHTAQKLQQMWTEIVTTYRRAHNSSLKNGGDKPFLDSCGGRLDLLYLHMALTLEPELHKLVLSEIPRSKVIPSKIVSNSAVQPPAVTARKVKPKTTHETVEEPHLAASSSIAQPERGPRFVELQNPEMLPDWLLEDQAKTAAERGIALDDPQPSLQAEQLVFPTVLEAPTKARKPAASKVKKTEAVSNRAPEIAPVQTRDMVLHASAINSIDDSASSDYETAERTDPVSSADRRRAPGKRRRESMPTDVVELPSSRELVPHPHKRMHTAVTTTMTRSQETLLPPDEFDVLHNRLQKINESIDQCYRTLSNRDAILNDMHRADIESDLRFYLGIKKRIQEQVVMLMHGY